MTCFAYDPQDKIIYAAIMMIAVLYVIPVLVTVATKGSILGISHLKKCGKSLWPNVILDANPVTPPKINSKSP